VKIRDAVERAFGGNPADEARRQRLSEEGAQVWVLNGTDNPGRGSSVAGFLAYQGMAASAPRQRPDGAVPSKTRIVLYNAKPEDFPETVKYLERRFKVEVKTETDPSVGADIVITIGGTRRTSRRPSRGTVSECSDTWERDRRATSGRHRVTACVGSPGERFSGPGHPKSPNGSLSERNGDSSHQVALHASRIANEPPDCSPGEPAPDLPPASGAGLEPRSRPGSGPPTRSASASGCIRGAAREPRRSSAG
jgi:hypothetical protein